VYIEETSREIATWYKKHCRYIKTNNPKSAYALQSLNNKLEYGTPDTTVCLIKQCDRDNKILIWENFFFMQYYHFRQKLVAEQIPHEYKCFSLWTGLATMLMLPPTWHPPTTLTQ
jgi:hypothetical protein